MDDRLAAPADKMEIHRARKIGGRVAATLTAPGRNFVTVRGDALDLGFAGIPGDYHEGATRRSGGREPWYPRGTEMRNERQLSLVAGDELATVAARMGIAEVRPEWVGANLVIDNVPAFSMLPAGTLLFFSGGVTLKVDGQNHPCRLAGRAVAKGAAMGDREAAALDFVKQAKRLRGLVAWVEKPGRIVPGEDVALRLPEQWIYQL